MIEVGRVVVTEGHAGTTGAVFTLRLSSAYDLPVTVDYVTRNGDLWDWTYTYPPAAAVAGQDYQAAAGTLTFAPGETSRQITVQVIGDREDEEWIEVFSLMLPRATHARALEPGTVAWILDDEPAVGIDGASVVEGDAGTSAMVFTVSLTAAYDVPLTVAYATSDLTARAATDYTATSGVLSLRPARPPGRSPSRSRGMSSSSRRSTSTSPSAAPAPAGSPRRPPSA